MIVIDASALIELMMLTEAGLDVARRVFATPEEIHAPELIDLEVGQVLRRYVQIGDMTEDRAGAMFEDLASIRMRRYPHLPLLPRIWQLRHNLTAYDASYVALAEGLEARLLTRDGALAEAPHRADVVVV